MVQYSISNMFNVRMIFRHILTFKHYVPGTMLCPYTGTSVLLSSWPMPRVLTPFIILDENLALPTGIWGEIWPTSSGEMIMPY